MRKHIFLFFTQADSSRLAAQYILLCTIWVNCKGCNFLAAGHYAPFLSWFLIDFLIILLFKSVMRAWHGEVEIFLTADFYGPKISFLFQYVIKAVYS